MLSVQFIGSGDAFGSGGRFQTCLRLAHQAGSLLIDCVFPQGDGASQPSYATTTSYTKVDLGSCSPDASGAATAGSQCCVQLWKQETFPDGSAHKSAVCAASPTYSGSDGVLPHGWIIAEEIWANGGTAPAKSQ